MDVHYCEVGLSKPVPQEVILSLRLHILHLMRSYLSVKTIYFLCLRYTCFMVFLALAQFEKLGPNTLIHELGHTKNNPQPSNFTSDEVLPNLKE